MYIVSRMMLFYLTPIQPSEICARVSQRAVLTRTRTKTIVPVLTWSGTLGLTPPPGAHKHTPTSLSHRDLFCGWKMCSSHYCCCVDGNYSNSSPKFSSSSNENKEGLKTISKATKYTAIYHQPIDMYLYQRCSVHIVANTKPSNSNFNKQAYRRHDNTTGCCPNSFRAVTSTTRFFPDRNSPHACMCVNSSSTNSSQPWKPRGIKTMYTHHQ